MSMPRGTRTRTRTRRAPYFTQKGVALIAVIVATAIAGVFVAEFSTSTNVDMAAARNAEADMKSHFLARSGMNLSLLAIKLQTQVLDRQDVRRMIGDFQIADYIGLFMGAFGGSKEEVEGLGAMLGGFSGDLKGLGVPEGSFDVQITTEDNKININCAGGGQATQEHLQAQLAGLFYFDAYNPIFENEDADGWRRDRETQVAAFMDYVDPDRARFKAEGSPEDYGYETLSDKYEAKDNYLDSAGELRLVRGVDDRFWSLFGEAFTVYGSCKLNLAAVDDPMLLANIIFLSAKDRNDPAANDPQNLWALAQIVIKARELGFVFSTAEDFAEFIKSPKDALEQLLGGGESSSLSGANLGAALGQAGGPASDFVALVQQVKGVELELSEAKGGLKQIATVGPRRTYRVEATATYGKMQKRMTGIWDKDAPNNQNTRLPGNQESREGGAWVFWRED